MVTAAQPATAAMPWEIVSLPFRGAPRDYKKYADGSSMLATEEESRIWAYVQGLRQELADAKAANQVERMSRRK